MNKRVWIEVDLNKIKSNYEIIKKKANGAKVCCVIKDNAYGHGSVCLAKLYELLNTDYFAVSNINEAIELRQNNINTPILILGYTPIEKAKDLNTYNITQCIYSLEYAKDLNNQNYKIKCHLKIDTGMNRLGFKNLDEMIETLNLSNLEFEGIFTHFANSEDDKLINKQYLDFISVINELKENGFEFKIKHCANSMSLFLHSEYNLDMVRPGIVLYGLEGRGEIKQAMKLKSVISHIKKVNKGEGIGYNHKYIAKKDLKVATIPIGYGDGYLRVNSGKNYIIVNNQKCPILGNVCMDQLMIDVSDVECKLYDEVIVYDDIEECAKNINTISYELICGIDSRVPIVYID